MAITTPAAAHSLLQGTHKTEDKTFFFDVYGKTICLTLDPRTTTMGHVKMMLASKMGTSMELVVAGPKMLQDHQTLDLLSGSTRSLSVYHPRKGGCFMVSCSILATICAALIGSTCTCGLSLLIIPVLMPLLFVLPFFCL